MGGWVVPLLHTTRDCANGDEHITDIVLHESPFTHKRTKGRQANSHGDLQTYRHRGKEANRQIYR